MAAAPVALLSASSRGSRTHVGATPFSGRLWVSGTARPAAVCARPALPAREATAPRAFTGSAASSRRPQHGLPNALPPTAERSADQPARPLPRDVENVADDPNLANPLLRHQRLSTAWMGVILEFEGIVLQSTWEAHLEAWLTVAEEEGKSPPLQWEVKRAEGMKNEQVVSEVFHWTRNPSEIRRISERKEEVYRDLTADIKPTLMPGVKQLLDILNKNDVPVALASSDPERRVMHGLEAVGVLDAFSAVVTAGDCQYSRPDPEPYLYAAQLLQRPPVRCVVIGASNASIEGAHEAGMQCVVAAGRSPIYELTSGDLVVKDLTEISFMNLKQLFQLEQLTTLSSEDDQFGPTPELEYEKEESSSTQTATMTLDYPYDDFL
mmetsp:Transcript_43742/g.109746  ORF Transcript_43742/g.109746 Transcript_43742/m.109746 type:complete len:380 (+) Transcript_43742:451-1590(+)|eukprot:jgi/Tetstr1/456533/TSEL_043255.t1